MAFDEGLGGSSGSLLVSGVSEDAYRRRYMITSALEFKQLRESQYPEEYRRAASEDAPLEVWYDILREYPGMAYWVAQNKTVPYEILEVLAEHPDPRTRGMVAMKKKLQEPLLLKLAEDQDSGVRFQIATHKHATKSVLLRLQHDSWAAIRDIIQARLHAEDFV